MRAITKRFMALPVATAGAVALVLAGSGAAHASMFENGSVSITLSDSFLNQLANHGFHVTPQGYSSLTHDSTNHTETITFAATAGDASLNNGAGSLSLSGDIIIKHWCHTVKLSSLMFNLTGASVDGSTTTSGDQQLLDLAGSVGGSVTPNADGSNTQVVTSDNLDIDTNGAAFLNTALHSRQFIAGQNVGSFSATWTN